MLGQPSLTLQDPFDDLTLGHALACQRIAIGALLEGLFHGYLHCDELKVCREIANGSKHMRKNRVDPNIKAQAVWAKAIDGAWFAKPGDLVMSLRVTHNDKETDAERAFIEAAGFWEKLMIELNVFTKDARLPEKIMKAG
jgi:hypothetical protein